MHVISPSVWFSRIVANYRRGSPPRWRRHHGSMHTAVTRRLRPNRADETSGFDTYLLSGARDEHDGGVDGGDVCAGAMTPPVDVRRGLRWSGCRCGVRSAVTSAMAVRVADSWTMALSPRRRQPTDRSSSSTSSGGWPTKRWDTASILFQAVASRHVPTELAEFRRSQYTAVPDARVLATAAHNVAALKTALTEAFQDHPDAPILMSFPGSLSSVAACSEIGADRTGFATARGPRPTRAPRRSPDSAAPKAYRPAGGTQQTTHQCGRPVGTPLILHSVDARAHNDHHRQCGDSHTAASRSGPIATSACCTTACTPARSTNRRRHWHTGRHGPIRPHPDS